MGLAICDPMCFSDSDGSELNEEPGPVFSPNSTFMVQLCGDANDGVYISFLSSAFNLTIDGYMELQLVNSPPKGESEFQIISAPKVRGTFIAHSITNRMNITTNYHLQIIYTDTSVSVIITNNPSRSMDTMILFLLICLFLGLAFVWVCDVTGKYELTWNHTKFRAHIIVCSIAVVTCGLFFFPLESFYLAIMLTMATVTIVMLLVTWGVWYGEYYDQSPHPYSSPMLLM
jgi:hypothetical protein